MRKSKEHVDFVSRNQEDFFVEKFEKIYIIEHMQAVYF